MKKRETTSDDHPGAAGSVSDPSTAAGQLTCGHECSPWQGCQSLCSMALDLAIDLTASHSGHVMIVEPETGVQLALAVKGRTPPGREAFHQSPEHEGGSEDDQLAVPIMTEKALLGHFVLYGAGGPRPEGCLRRVRNLALILSAAIQGTIQYSRLSRLERHAAILQREVDHRVRNNLQILSSLMSLDARASIGAESSLLRRFLDRISAMRLAHEYVEAASRDARTDIRRLVSSLVDVVRFNQRTEQTAVDARLEVDHLSLHPDHAFPLSLLLAVLISAAIESLPGACPGGELAVTLTRNGERALLKVEAVPQGPEQALSPPSYSLVLQMAWSLALQLSGQIRQASEKPFSALIDFRVEPPC